VLVGLVLVAVALVGMRILWAIGAGAADQSDELERREAQRRGRPGV